ncbi:MAG TPA: sigma-70 family RNA polymerase sigma factor [Polyangiaceae bacterium]|nr:sigma-70 family RNA polymerase sigma factor [Polyangiaceae bacterium]
MSDASHQARTTNSESHFPAATWIPSVRPTAVRPTASRRKTPRTTRSTRRPASVFPATIVRRDPRSGRDLGLPQNAAQLLDEYRPLVQKIAGGFQRRLPRHVLREDLIAAGMAGLWDAIRKHGNSVEDGFEWYVRVRVRGAILDELRSQDWLSRRARAAAEASGQSIPPHVVHLDDMREPEQARCLAIPTHGESEIAQRDQRAALARAVEQLPERERFIVSEHYFGDVKFKTLSEALGVSEPRVSQLHSRAMKRLREIVSADAAV